MNSLIYSVLDTAVEYQADRDIRQEAQDFGAYVTAEMLVKLARFHPDSESDPEPPWATVNPWEAELLRALAPSDIVLAVEQWTEKVPLVSRSAIKDCRMGLRSDNSVIHMLHNFSSPQIGGLNSRVGLGRKRHFSDKKLTELPILHLR